MVDFRGMRYASFGEEAVCIFVFVRPEWCLCRHSIFVSLLKDNHIYFNWCRRMRDDLQLIRDKTTELEIKVDRDINELKSSVEKGKNDTVRMFGTFHFLLNSTTLLLQNNWSTPQEGGINAKHNSP